MMLESDFIKEIDFEVSSICNAGCPVCSRMYQGHYTPFPQTYWSIDEVERVFEKSIIKNLQRLSICGNYGDAMGNPDIVKIVEWVRRINRNCYIDIRTNAGIGKREFYERLGQLNVHMVFGIDGVGEANKLHRVNVDWEKVHENVAAFSSKAWTHRRELQFLLWNETTDQIVPIIDFCREMMIDTLYLRRPYTHGDWTEVFSIDGKSTHFLSELKDPSAEFIIESRWRLEELEGLRERVIAANIPVGELRVSDMQEKPKRVWTERPYYYDPTDFTDEEIEQMESKKKQTCFSKNSIDSSRLTGNSYNVYVTHNKLLMPCCLIPPYITNHITHYSGYSTGYEREIMNKMIEIGFDRFSLKNKTLAETINGGVLRDFIYDDLEKGDAFGLCKFHCGRCE